MPILRIPTPLRPYTNGQSEVKTKGAKVSEALADLITNYPALKPHLFTEAGDLRAFVNLFLGEHNVRELQGLDTAIKEDDKLLLIPSIAGGCHCEDGARPSEAISEFGRRLLRRIEQARASQRHSGVGGFHASRT